MALKLVSDFKGEMKSHYEKGATHKKHGAKKV